MAKQATRNQAVALYRALLAAKPAAERAEFKAHLDAMIEIAAEGVTSRPRYVVAAETLVAQAGIAFGTVETRSTDESDNWGAFLTGGHRFTRYAAARRFVRQYWPAGAALLVDRGY